MGIKIGFVSSAGTAGVAVNYPDENKTTDELPVLSFGGLRQSFQKGDAVIVAHLTNDNSSGVVLGGYYSEDSPCAEIAVNGGSMILSDSSGAISLAEIIAK